ncbi:Myosin-6 [Hondaea fermentalgiana]|uniref:Myosin-6 n=1 Tax=Hondaea fermentalgiana TaxID=2315210 RepID=A0A2R5GMB8_9STRA|nr:Myosin-6 [Hondaea fermentalgiana]|eukprot:GBG31775.1 Myosin-6 [Hondaea fermentalgiana]
MATTNNAGEVRRSSYWADETKARKRASVRQERRALSERRGSKWSARFNAFTGHRVSRHESFPVQKTGWEPRYALDGSLYYFEHETGMVSWDKPDSLKTQHELDEDEAEWVWVPHPKNVWQPARVKSREKSGEVVVRLFDNKTVRIPHIRVMKGKLTGGVSQKVPLWPLKRSALDRVEADLVALPALDEGMIMHNLRMRYESNDIYTWVGSSRNVLISINPFQDLFLYGEDRMKVQKQSAIAEGNGGGMAPHVFAIANDALESLLLENKSQSILVSGESGAGKTHSTKACLDYLAFVAGSDQKAASGGNGRFEMMAASSSMGADHKVEQKVLVANPVLEAFGNAKTVRNNNSSRFGKWIAVYFDRYTKLINGASITSFLLESSRVTILAEGERNYHVFYQILSDPAVRDKYMLMESPEYYRYLNQSKATTADTIDDEADYVEVVDALEELEIEEEEQEWLFRTVAAVLHLGNVEFSEIKMPDGQRGCKLVGDTGPATDHGSTTDVPESIEGSGDKGDRNLSMVGGSRPPAWIALEHAAELLEIQDAALERVLTRRSITVRGEESVIPLKVRQAVQARDSLAKAIYSRLFDWLVNRINESFGEAEGKFIGILDVFGFEIFEHNSFEQLCINFANERLQQLFNQTTFGDEEELYEVERVQFRHIDFEDNQIVLDLIDKRPDGILNLLDDECLVPGGTDERFMGRIESVHADHPRFQGLGSASSKNRAVARSKDDELAFSIKHFAGTVVYDARGFMAKNSDTLYQDLYNVCSYSEDDMTRMLFPPLDEDDRVKVISQSAKFRAQLSELMTILRKTETRYIRCIKPNDAQKPSMFEGRKCLEQLRASGVFEAVEIRKTGYPFRLFHEEFAARYRCINVGYAYSHEDPKLLCREILEASPQAFAGVQIGETRILYRVEDHKVLELLRNLALATVVPRIQTVWRLGLGRRLRRNLIKAEKGLTDAMNAEEPDLVDLETAIDDVPDILGSVGNIFRINPPSLEAARKLHAGLEQWESVEEDFETLEDIEDNTSPDFDRHTAEAYLGDADRLREEGFPMTERQKELYDHVKSLVLGKQAEDEVGELAEEALKEPTRDKVISAARESAGWTMPRNVAVAKIRETAGRYEKLDEDLKRAVDLVDHELLEKAVLEADELEYTSDSVEEAKALLALPDKKFASLELEAAKRHRDRKRRVQRDLRIRELELATHFSKYEDFFANERIRGNVYHGFCASSLRFLRWNSKPSEPSNAILEEIAERHRDSTSTTMSPMSGRPVTQQTGPRSRLGIKFSLNLDSSLLYTGDRDNVSDALRVFGLIKTYMGDSKRGRTDFVARNNAGYELVCMGLDPDADFLHDEIFCQIVRQLTENPKEESIAAGVDLLCVCITAFQPSDEIMENFLTVWVRLHLPDEIYRTFVSTIHEARFSESFDDRVDELMQLDRVAITRAERRESTMGRVPMQPIRNEDINNFRAKHVLGNLRKLFKAYAPPSGSRWSLRHGWEADPWAENKRFESARSLITPEDFGLKSLQGLGSPDPILRPPGGLRGALGRFSSSLRKIPSMSMMTAH